MNKTLVTSFILFCFSISSASLLAQQRESLDNTSSQEEDVIGGIGGTGIREMSRPEILERPERLERPELLESRDALEDIIDRDSATDAAMESIDKPEKPESH